MSPLKQQFWLLLEQDVVQYWYISHVNYSLTHVGGSIWVRRQWNKIVFFKTWILYQRKCLTDNDINHWITSHNLWSMMIKIRTYATKYSLHKAFWSTNLFSNLLVDIWINYCSLYVYQPLISFTLLMTKQVQSSNVFLSEVYNQS